MPYQPYNVPSPQSGGGGYGEIAAVLVPLLMKSGDPTNTAPSANQASALNAGQGPVSPFAADFWSNQLGNAIANPITAPSSPKLQLKGYQANLYPPPQQQHNSY